MIWEGRLHTILAFISVVGGLILLGPAGLILGPVALTITTVLLEIWRNRAGDPPTANPHPKTRPPLVEGGSA